MKRAKKMKMKKKTVLKTKAMKAVIPKIDGKRRRREGKSD